ncbi:DUF881 domain-containing protein [Mycolicibacterium brumae]|uniref:DUF881 domain-containing protein n=1 Tax=Mycolicibacterium brumae TaxID=85968 RepID=A0A2G5PDS5_9MYCO|nr:DUF881 domain-containing protein [Mycolicibacterium brumae]MCV7192867.1 DUF881 domain-containing protein [Mycolicibacterium brumae]PIB76466.1 DUF881 domain-containing protein [Mycolicibacterium brumae]UWW08613.1 DUF881 domain-containing protein [Mycolicibacterium brumae]
MADDAPEPETPEPETPEPAEPETAEPGVARRGRVVFGLLAVLLCALLGAALVTQVRQTRSGDALDTARPADLAVLLGSLQQREAVLNTEIAELRQTLNTLTAAGDSDQAAIENARARLTALSIITGTVGATGPGVTLKITDPARGVAPEVLLDIINELRAAGAETMQIDSGDTSVRVGVDTWVRGVPGALQIDGITMAAPLTVRAIGDPPTLAAAMNIPGGASDSVERVGGKMTVGQSERVDVPALRQPKQRQYAQPVK